MTGLLKALGEFFKGQNKITVLPMSEQQVESCRAAIIRDKDAKNVIESNMRARLLSPSITERINKSRERQKILNSIQYIRSWKSNAIATQLKYYKLFAPVYFPDRESMADVRLVTSLIRAINVKCKEDREKRKAPKPRWIQG